MSCTNTITWQQWLWGGGNYQRHPPAFLEHKCALTFTGGSRAIQLAHICIQIICLICTIWDLVENKIKKGTDTDVYIELYYTLQVKDHLLKYLQSIYIHKLKITTTKGCKGPLFYCTVVMTEQRNWKRYKLDVCVWATPWQSFFHIKCVKFHCCASEKAICQRQLDQSERCWCQKQLEPWYSRQSISHHFF